MTATEEIYYKLGLKLIVNKVNFQVYKGEHDGFDVEIHYSFDTIIVIIVAKFEFTTIKVSNTFPNFHILGHNPIVEYRDLKDKIINTLHQFSNILVSKSNEFHNEVKRIESLTDIDL